MSKLKWTQKICLTNPRFNNISKFICEFVLHLCFQGNQHNRSVMLNSKVIDYINFILRAGEFKNCDGSQVNKCHLFLKFLFQNLKPTAIIYVQNSFIKLLNVNYKIAKYSRLTRTKCLMCLSLTDKETNVWLNMTFK